MGFVMACGGWAVCGCSGSGASAQGAQEAPGAQAAGEVRGAAGKLVAAGSAEARTAMEMASGGTRVTIRGEGGLRLRGGCRPAQGAAAADPAGARDRKPITELLAPGALYMKNRGAGVPADKWVRVETGALSDGNLVTGGATDPYVAAQVLRGTRTAAYVGRTEVAGTPVRHYRGTADLGRAARAAGGAAGRSLRAAAKGFATAEVPFDVYLDDDGRIRKLRHRFSFVNGQRGDTVAVTSTTLLYDFGVPVTVRLPAEDDIDAGKIADEPGGED
ncbi:Lipoprotein OS=Streptomyces fumanus OX=67302 GN=GCM10018772_29060 PE=4 SV=1 [Streptomyces fumanus]